MNSGNYKGMSERYNKIFIVVMVLTFLPVLYLSINTGYLFSFFVLIVYAAAYIGFAELMANLPCEWSADAEGFTITELRQQFRHTYAEIESAELTVKEVESKFSEGFTKVVLTVTERSGKVSVYTERVDVEYEKFTEHPERCLRPQLDILYERISRERGIRS